MKRSKGDEEKIKDLIKKTEEFFQQEKYQEIIDLLPDETLNQYQDSDLFAWKAWANFRLPDADKALDCAEKALKINPKNPSALRLRGLVNLNKGIIIML